MNATAQAPRVLITAPAQLAATTLAASALAAIQALVLAALNAQAGHLSAGRVGICVLVTLVAGLYAGFGHLIATRRPRNPIGWLLSLTGLVLVLSVLTEQYALYGLATAPGALPGTWLAGWLAGTLAAVTIVLVALIILLFPDGRLPSRRWRPVLWAIAVVMTGWLATQLQAGTAVTGGYVNSLDPAGVTYPNPLGLFPRHGWFSHLVAANFILAALTAIAVVASVFARRRTASKGKGKGKGQGQGQGQGASKSEDTELRKQLAWLGYVGLMTAASVPVFLVGSAFAHGTSAWLLFTLWSLMVLTPVAGLPLACAVAVLKYRLYDIDRLISRTVAYAILTGLLVGVYAGLVLLTSAILPSHTQVAVAVATLVAAALFSPLRRRVQAVVDRRFNRARYDAERTVTAFAGRLADAGATDLDAISQDLAATVHQALEPTHLSLWSRRDHPHRKEL
jgi:MFS family permease